MLAAAIDKTASAIRAVARLRRGESCSVSTTISRQWQRAPGRARSDGCRDRGRLGPRLTSIRCGQEASTLLQETMSLVDQLNTVFVIRRLVRHGDRPPAEATVRGSVNEGLAARGPQEYPRRAVGRRLEVPELRAHGQMTEGWHRSRSRMRRGPQAKICRPADDQ